MRPRLVIAFLVASLLATQAGSDGTASAQRYLYAYSMPYVDFVPTRPTSPQLVDDAIPRVYVRFDDARAGVDPANPVKHQVAAFLRRGIPCAITINADNIGTGGFMSWDDIRDLMRFARSRGTQLHLMQHFNGNFPTPFLATHQDVINELDPTEILNETGYRVRFAALPGNPGRQEFYRRNREYVQSVADSLGIWFINSVTPQDSSSWASFSPSVVELDNFSAGESNYLLGSINQYQYTRPSLGIPRNEIPSGPTDVAGEFAVERVASWASQYDSVRYYDRDEHYLYGGEHLTGVIPPNVDGWTLTENGANPAGAVAYKQTIEHFISSRLANNYGFNFVCHDSADANTVSGISGISDAEYSAGAWSPEHLAWILAMLSRTELPDGTPIQPHIKVVGPEEYALWATGEYAPQTDLIQNPSCIIPQYDIGDTLGATSEYPWVRGLSVIGTQATAQPQTTAWIRNLAVEQTGNVAKYDRGEANNPYDLIGLGVTGVRGRSGGISMNGTAPNIIRVGWGNLPPGRYRFSLAANVETILTVSELHIAQKIKGYKLISSSEAGFSPAYNDTLIRWKWKDADEAVSFGDTFYRNKWGDLFLPLEFPAVLMGQDSSAFRWGSSSEATADSLWQPFDNITDNAQSEFIPLVNSARWGFTLALYTNDAVTFSNPRLIYLGD